MCKLGEFFPLGVFGVYVGRKPFFFAYVGRVCWEKDYSSSCVCMCVWVLIVGCI